MREKICGCLLLLSSSFMHTSRSAYTVLCLQLLASDMYTRGISSSRDQYNWGAYYKAKANRNFIFKCVQRQATNER